MADTRTLVFSTFDRPISVCGVLLHLRLHSLSPFSFSSQKLHGHSYCRCDYCCDSAQNTAVSELLCGTLHGIMFTIINWKSLAIRV